MRLLPLPDGTASLEFMPFEAAFIRSAIASLYGDYAREPIIDGARLRFACEDFLYIDEWDQPCVIATTYRGAGMLRTIVDSLAAPEAEALCEPLVDDSMAQTTPLQWRLSEDPDPAVVAGSVARAAKGESIL